MSTATGLGFANISLALAVSQFVSGIARPICGAFADRHGPSRVIFTGGLFSAGGIALLPLARSMALELTSDCDWVWGAEVALALLAALVHLAIWETRRQRPVVACGGFGGQAE